jgi:hypothetical protein
MTDLAPLACCSGGSGVCSSVEPVRQRRLGRWRVAAPTAPEPKVNASQIGSCRRADLDRAAAAETGSAGALSQDQDDRPELGRARRLLEGRLLEGRSGGPVLAPVHGASAVASVGVDACRDSRRLVSVAGGLGRAGKRSCGEEVVRGRGRAGVLSTSGPWARTGVLSLGLSVGPSPVAPTRVPGLAS